MSFQQHETTFLNVDVSFRQSIELEKKGQVTTFKNYDQCLNCMEEISEISVISGSIGE